MKKLLNWRVQLVGGQSFCYFDPMNERIMVIELTPEEKASMVKEYGSVSALVGARGRQRLLGI